MILNIRKSQKNLFVIYLELVFNFCFSASEIQEGTSPIPPNVDPTAYDLILLEVEDILPSPLAPLVLQPTVPEPVCEMQTPAFFTMAQSSPQPQSVDTTNYARVNPLPSPATSSSSGELHLYIESDTSPPAAPMGQASSSQELLLQGNVQTAQPPPPTTALTEAQPPISIPSWADETAAAQSGRSTPDSVVPNWAYSGRIRGPRPRSQPLVYPPPVMPTPFSSRQPTLSQRYGPVIPPIRPQPTFPQPPPYDRPTSTDNYPCTGPSPLSRPKATPQEVYPVRSSPVQASQSPARHTASPSRGPQLSSSRPKGNPFAPTQGIVHRSQGPIFRFHEFTNPLGINTVQGIHVAERFNYTSNTTPTYSQTHRQLLLTWTAGK